jgi:F-type H+-transporting ATPase subunit epsilon
MRAIVSKKLKTDLETTLFMARAQFEPRTKSEAGQVASFMNLKILLPDGIFARKSNVSLIVAETFEGAFGLLPQRSDCVASLVPGILIYESEGGTEVCVAVDDGVLVKTGFDVHVSVRNAVSGTDLSRLRAVVDEEFLNLFGGRTIVR